MANATNFGGGNNVAAPDYARYDRIWQRVAPAMNPYPQVRAAAAPAEIAPQPEHQAVRAENGGISAAEQARELALPGAQADPSCMVCVLGSWRRCIF